MVCPRGGIFNKLRLDSPPGGWFPALQDLSWYITDSNLPYANLFFSPHLKSISTPHGHGKAPKSPPTPCQPWPRPSPHCQHQAFGGYGCASFVARCPGYISKTRSVVLHFRLSFMEYDSPIPLSDAATNHLVQFPHLHTLRIYSPPPNYSASSLPHVFPPLRELTLVEGSAGGWLHCSNA